MNTTQPIKHIAIIPDGNRRWAKQKGLPTIEGHRRGFNQITDLVREARVLNIKIFTIWAFSTENWKRSQMEIDYLMNLYLKMIDLHFKEAFKNETRIIHIGRKDRINEHLRKKIEEAENKTKIFSKYYLVIALDYGGQDELLRAFQKVGNLTFDNINQFLDTKNLPFPEPDLVIRTSGESRTSGFMIWQSAYSELIFSEKFFPDFTKDDLRLAISEYQKRKRRFGK